MLRSRRRHSIGNRLQSASVSRASSLGPPIAYMAKQRTGKRNVINYLLLFSRSLLTRAVANGKVWGSANRFLRWLSTQMALQILEDRGHRAVVRR